MAQQVEISPKKVYVYVASALLVWMSWSAFRMPLFEYAPQEDFWEHAAVIKEWSTNFSSPKEPQLGVDAGSARYSPYSLVFACIAKLFDVSAIDALQIAAICNTVLFVLGAFLFLRVYFRDEWAPVIGLMVFLVLWGTGFRWANEYQLRTLFYVAPYPSTFCYGVGLLSFWLALRIARSEIPLWWSSALALLVAIAVLSHLPTGAAFVMGGIGVLCIGETGALWRYRMIPIVAAIAGLALTELWPMFSLLDLALGAGSPGQHKLLFYDPIRVVLALGPALLGVPAVFYLAFKRRQLAIVYGFLVMITGYAINRFWPVVTGERFFYFAVFFLHMALVWTVLRSLEYAKESMLSDRFLLRQRVMLAVAGITLCGSLAWSVAYATAHFAYTYLRKEPVTLVMKRLGAFLNEDSMVLAPPTSIGWPIPSFEGKVVAVMYNRSTVPDYRRRVQDAAAFFEAGTSNERRLDIIRRYKVSHVLFGASDVPEEVRYFLNEAGVALGSVPGYCHRDHINDIKEEWTNIFRPCARGMIEVFKVGEGLIAER